MPTKSGFADLSGTHLYYEVAGSGPPLVFIHGFGLDSRMWDDQFTPLAQRFQVIRYDARGFGKSSLPTSEPYTHASDLRKLLLLLGISQASVVGLSMGGWIATNFTLTNPAMVERLVLVDSTLIGYQSSPDWNRELEKIAAEAAEVGPKAANDLWLQHPVFAPARENADVAARLTAMVADYSGWHWANEDPHLWTERPDIERLDQITVPTLIIIGQRDLPNFHGIATILQQRISKASTVTLDQVGHMSNMEAPTAFNQLVEDFIGSS